MHRPPSIAEPTLAFGVSPARRPREAGGLRVVELKTLAPRQRSRVIETLAEVYHAEWGDGTENYATPQQAQEELRRRFARPAHAATFVALTHEGEVAGTGSIGNDDYYDGFSASNGIDPGLVGRDLYTMSAFRGVVMHGLKVWEHLLEARLKWVMERRKSHLTVFTEAGPIDLPALYGRLGATVLRRGLHHRRLGRHAITMLGYPARHSLDMLAQVRRARAEAAGPRSPRMAPMRPRSPSAGTRAQRGLRLQG